MQVWFVQVVLGEEFEDLYVEAKSAEQAKKLALKATRLQSRWANAIV